MTGTRDWYRRNFPTSRDGIMSKSESRSEERDDTRSERERITAPEAMRHASEQLAGLLGSEPESVSALKATDDGWSAAVEVVEIERVPDTASVMATYRVDLDERGRLLGYERIQRYSRGQIDRR
jgi:hypothetical protein